MKITFVIEDLNKASREVKVETISDKGASTLYLEIKNGGNENACQDVAEALLDSIDRVTSDVLGFNINKNK